MNVSEEKQNEELQNEEPQIEQTPFKEEERVLTETQAVEVEQPILEVDQAILEEERPILEEEQPTEEVRPVEVEEEQPRQEEEKESNMSEKGNGKSNFWFYGILLAMILAVFSFRVYWNNSFGGVVVDGASMNKTLQSGDKLLMRYCKDADELQRGDVIVVKVEGYEEFSDSTTKYLIKRLIAIEGDKVRCTDGQIEICYAGTTEYQLLAEPYAYYTNRNLYDFGEYVVGEDEIFFLGDNRNNSCDSRYKEVGGSHLEKLYKESDVYGIVSDWAIENRSWLSKVFFWNAD